MGKTKLDQCPQISHSLWGKQGCEKNIALRGRGDRTTALERQKKEDQLGKAFGEVFLRRDACRQDWSTVSSRERGSVRKAFVIHQEHVLGWGSGEE